MTDRGLVVMNDCKKLFDTIDNLKEEFISHWINISNIESPTLFKEGLDKVGQYFIDYAKKEGWDVEVLEHETAGNSVCITMNKDVPNAPITLSGHIDTVHPVGSFGTPPVKVKDDFIYGPGVTDCKGGTVAALCAMKALKTVGFNTRPVQLVLQTDEELGSMPSGRKTIEFMTKKAKDSICFLNCESSRLGESSAVLWRRGITKYRFDIKGVSIHASKCDHGASAITEAAHKIIELEKMKDTNGLTCNCGIIEGGTAVNTVPENCYFYAEVRYNTNAEKEEGYKKVKSIAETTFIKGTTCTFTEEANRFAMEKCQRNFELLDRMNEIYKANGLPELAARQSLGGSDAADMTVAGIPCVDSIGTDGDFIHTTKEYGVLSSLAQATKRIAVVCYMI